ncbi:MAG TPA: porin [Polyangiaceae bacterium]|nr:porin [Polyangiaceae bacterium]
MASRSRLFAACLQGLACLSLSTALFLPRSARAEKVIAKGDNWEVYTDGRAGAFVNWVTGDGAPVATQTITMPDGSQQKEVIPGGWLVNTTDSTETYQGKVNTVRIRSGFIGNTLGLGVRTEVFPGLKASAYIQMWAVIEPDNRNKAAAIPPDLRQGYAKLEGAWGSVLAGRTRTLFSRGATDINVLYAHRWGVGFPGGGGGTNSIIDGKGPTGGMVGFGVLGSGFGTAFIYGSPVLGGLQLNVGLFDPASLGSNGWTRTKLPRVESELTFERPFGLGKVVLFANGAYQKVYQPGACPLPGATSSGPCDATAAGVGYGGRLEIGPVHLGVAGHYGKGLGMAYALEQSYAALDPGNNLRTFDGYYAQSQVVVQKFDFFAGAGITRVFLTDYDKTVAVQYSNVKHQIGINGGVVYNLAENVHLDLEYFRAQADYWYGEKQVLNSVASGMTVNW